MYKTETKWQMGLKGIERLECITYCLLKSHLSCLAIYICFELNSAQSSGERKIGNVTVKIYLKESLLSLLCFIINGQGSFEKGFKILNFETEIYLNDVAQVTIA